MILSLALAGFIDGHLNQPGAEPRFRPELREMLERLEESFLCRIFRVLFVPQNRERDYKDAPLVWSYEIVKQLSFTTLNAPDKGGFLFVAGVRLRHTQVRCPLDGSGESGTAVPADNHRRKSGIPNWRISKA